MDNLLQRFLTKIGIKDLTPFEKGHFAALNNDKEHNLIEAKMHLPTYLKVSEYINLFDTISTFTSYGGFGISLSFSYDDEVSSFPDFLDNYIETKQCLYLSDMEFIQGEKKVIFFYESAGKEENMR